MDGSPADIPSGKSPRRELLGPRPAPLKVNKDSHKIKKPPVAPQLVKHSLPPPRAPVIIYTVSPKVIHANPNEFMKLVQRLTGPDKSSSSSTTTTNTSTCFQEHESGGGGGGGGAISPAARFASIEKTKTHDWRRSWLGDDQVGMVNEDIEIISSKVERVSHFPSILSPNPSSLPPIPSSFFSPSPSSYDANLLGFLSDLSPVATLHSNKNYIEGGSSNILLPSPSSFIISPQMISPSMIHQALDLFNSL